MRGRGPSDDYIEEMTDIVLKHPPEGMPPNLSREDVKGFVNIEETKRWMATRYVETPRKKIQEETLRAHCPDCSTNFTEDQIRPDGYVICKICRKRFKSPV